MLLGIIMFKNQVFLIFFPLSLVPNPCSVDSGGCEQICVLSHRSDNGGLGYRCKCRIGYDLHADGKRCLRKLRFVIKSFFLIFYFFAKLLAFESCFSSCILQLPSIQLWGSFCCSPASWLWEESPLTCPPRRTSSCRSPDHPPTSWVWILALRMMPSFSLTLQKILFTNKRWMEQVTIFFNSIKLKS